MNLASSEVYRLHPLTFHRYPSAMAATIQVKERYGPHRLKRYSGLTSLQ